MGQAKAAHEPSMDEILASIRKIIAEEPIGSRPVPAAQTKTEVASVDAAERPLAGSVRQPVPPFGAATETGPRNSPASDPLFGRLAEALGGGAPVVPTMTSRGQNSETSDIFAEDVDAAAESPVVVEPTAAETTGSSAVSAIADDLDDLLADDPINPAAGEGRAMARRSIDFGQVIPGDDKVDTAGQAAPKSAAGAVAKPSTHAVAFEKMLSNRLATGKVEAVASEPEPEGPVVIASMAEAGDSDSDSQTAIDLADAEASEEAKSAFGALMAGLEASAPASEPATEAESSRDLAEAEEAPEAAIDDDADAGHASGADEPAVAVAEAVVPRRVVEAHVELPSVAMPAVVMAGTAAAAATADQLTPNQTVSATSAVAAPEAGVAPVTTSGGAETQALPALAAVSGLSATFAPSAGGLTGVRTVEDIVAELLRPMLREWLAENMPRMVEKALRIELAEGLKTLDHKTAKSPREA